MWCSVFCSVCQVPVAEGKSVQQTVDILHKKLEQLGAVKQGSFCVDCETYHATGTVSGNISTFNFNIASVSPSPKFASVATSFRPLLTQTSWCQVCNGFS